MNNQPLPQPRLNHTGLWIPVQLKKLPIPRESHTLLATIQALDSGDPEYCFATNNYLAKEVGLSESRVSYYITLFKRLNLIQEVSFNGRIRRLKCLTHNWYLPINSKKESCVPTRRQTTCQRVGRLRADKKAIYSIIDTTRDNITPLPPDPPPPKKAEAPKEKTLSPPSSIGGGKVLKVSIGAIGYFDAKGKPSEVLLSDIWRHFVPLPYDSRIVQQAIDEFTGNASHIRDVFSYLEKICKRIVTQNNRKESAALTAKPQPEAAEPEDVVPKERLKTITLAEYFKQNKKPAEKHGNPLHIPKGPPS